MKSIVDYALHYLTQGIPVIPSCPKTKAPLVKWAQFQTKMPTKEEVFAMFKGFPRCMISAITGKISNLIVIDADSQEAIRKIEEYLPDSYELVIDVTPRGGRHYWFQMDALEYQSKSCIFEKCDIKCNGGVVCVPPSINYEGGKYTFLNQMDFKREMLHPMPEGLSVFINSIHAPINNIYNNSIYNIYNKNARIVPDALEMFKEGKRNQNLFPLALSLKEARRKPEYILQVLINIVPKMASTREGIKELIGIVDSAFKHEERKEISLSEEIREWVVSSTVSNTTFLSSDVYKDLDLSSRVDKKNCSKILHRLMEEGIIERHGDKRGSYRKVNKDIKYMDYVNAVPVTIDIKMPLHLHDVANITPKSIIVIAGSTNAGKTCFMLNVVKMNMQAFSSFNYLNSEMSPETLRGRLNRFREPIEFWHPKLKVIDCTSNFADAIDPNGINFIDYLELNPEKTYMVSKHILDIFNKLDKGVAFIGLQKASNASFGRGGEFNLEKAQLAISIDYNKAKIVKCKSPKTDFSYHNSVIDFTIEVGSLIVEKSGWKHG